MKSKFLPASKAGRCAIWAHAARKSASLCLMLLAATSCATGTARKPAPALIPPPPPSPAASLMQPCPPLEMLEVATLEAMLADHDQTTRQYHECRAKQARLVQAVQEMQANAQAWYCRALKQAGVREACSD